MIKYTALLALLAITFGVLSGCGSSVDSNANMANGVTCGRSPKLNGSIAPGSRTSVIIMNGNIVVYTMRRASHAVNS